MPPVDPADPVYRLNPPPPGGREPAPPPAYDPTANPVWGPLFSDERQSRGYRVRPEAVWLKAKDEYLRGFSAEAVCAEFDLGLSAFRQRARREGWRRSDVEEADPEPMSFPPEPEAAPPTAELADLAWRSAAQAIRRGRVYEARAWMRAAAELKALADEERVAARMADYHARRAAAAAADQEDAANGAEPQLHGLHGDFRVQSGKAAKDDDASETAGRPALDAALERTRRMLEALPGNKPP